MDMQTKWCDDNLFTAFFFSSGNETFLKMVEIETQVCPRNIIMYKGIEVKGGDKFYPCDLSRIAQFGETVRRRVTAYYRGIWLSVYKNVNEHG